jgi:hypothetical protein
MLSRLQQYILEECVGRGGSISRRVLDSNYQASRSRARGENFKKIITQSIERLITRGLIVGYGIKTKEKLFIEKIKLTAEGRSQAQRWRESRQARLPLHKYTKGHEY